MVEKNRKPFIKSTKKGIWKKNEMDSIGPDFHHFFEQKFSAPLNLNQDKTRSLFPYFSGNKSQTQIRQIATQQKKKEQWIQVLDTRLDVLVSWYPECGWGSERAKWAK